MLVGPHPHSMTRADRSPRAYPGQNVADLHDWAPAGSRLNAATTDAISSAGAAASRPLLSGPSPARASASSAEFVVNTPNVIGTPVADAASIRPFDTADAMNSKC